MGYFNFFFELYIYINNFLLIMPRKGKKTKHTRKELDAKVAKHKNKGGGKNGVKSRQPTTQFRCKICMTSIDSLKTMVKHYDARHRKVTFKESDYEDQAKKPKVKAALRPKTR